MISAPEVTKGAISGGRASISGNFTQASATSLANVLSYGALPLSFEVSSVDNVSAKLGGDQLQAGIIAGLIGLGLVLLYSILYYRGLALVVSLSLVVAGLLSWAMIVLLGASMGFALNLPGIAGAIVAIGVTADSFIIYFERIRDEVRDGRSLTTAIETGWLGSRKTIVIADAVSLLAAVVLKASTKEVVVYRRGQEIRITGKGLGFVAPMLAEKAPQSRRVRRGAIIRPGWSRPDTTHNPADRQPGARMWTATSAPAVPDRRNRCALARWPGRVPRWPRAGPPPSPRG